MAKIALESCPRQDMLVRAWHLYTDGTYSGGPDAAEQWERLMARVTPLGEAIFQLPSAAVRADLGAAITMGKYAGALAGVVLKGGGDKLNAPFATLLEEERITDPFIRNWLDMICFLLQERDSSRDRERQM